MNIVYPALFKAHDIANLKLPQSPGMIDQNFDRIVQNFKALRQYKIDLGQDVDESTSLALARLADVDEDVTSQFLRRDGTWAVPSGGFIQRPNDRMFAYSIVDIGAIRDVGLVSSSSGTTSQVTGNDGIFKRHATGAAATNTAHYDTNSLLRLDLNPLAQFHIKTGASIADLRLWFGWVGSTGFTDSDTLGTTGKGVAVRYSTVAGDAGWKGVTRDGTTQTTTVSTIPIAVDTIYKIQISVTAGGTIGVVTINDVDLDELTIGSAARGVDMFASGFVVTQAAAAKRFDLGRFYYERD